MKSTSAADTALNHLLTGNTISDPMSDNVIRKYTYLKVPYPMRPKEILLFGSLITVHHINNVIHVHDEPSA